ncbi:MAG: DMT family transporter [Gammaproteobacteria bacterium]
MLKVLNKGTLLYLLAVVMLAIMDASAKWLSDDYSIFQIALIRSFFSFLPILGLAMWNQKRRVSFLISRGRVLSHIVRGSLFTITFGSFVWSLKWLPLAEATGISLVAPIFMVLLGGILLKESIGVQKWLAIAIGLAGVLLIFQPGGGGPLFARLLALLSALSFALVAIWTRKLSSHDSSETIAFWTNTTLMAIGGAGVLFFSGWFTPGANDLPVFLIMGLAGGIANLLFVVALRLSEVSLVAALEYTIFIWAALLGAVFFAEIPSVNVWIGVGIIALGGIYTTTRKAAV